MPMCQELPPACFTFREQTYLLPMSDGPAWCSYRDVKHKKAYICGWRFADAARSDERRGSTYLRVLYVWDEITGELSEVGLPCIGLIEDITVLISENVHPWFRFVHEGGVSVYRMTEDEALIPVEADANTLLPLSKENWIDRIVCKDGSLHYTLMGREAAAISSTTGALSGNPFINMSHACYSDAIRCVFGCVDYYDLLTTRSCVLRYDHPEEAAEYFDGRLVAVSPDQAFGLLVWQQGNRVALRLLDLQSRSEVCCLLDKASVGVQACWTKDRCIIRDRNGLYSLTIGSDRNIRLSPLIRFVTNRCWYFETQDEFMIEKYSYWSKQNVFGYELMARDDIMDWLEPEYKHSYLSLQEMNERFADRPSLKPRFLQIEGCDMRGIRIDEAQRPKLLDILRYNGAIVDDE